MKEQAIRSMRFVYVCSPVRGDYINNIALAKARARKLYLEGYIPICVQGYLEEVTGLSEEGGDREELLRIGREMINLCDAVMVFNSQGISEGMKEEIRFAERTGKFVMYEELPIEQKDLNIGDASE